MSQKLSSQTTTKNLRVARRDTYAKWRINYLILRQRRIKRHYPPTPQPSPDRSMYNVLFCSIRSNARNFPLAVGFLFSSSTIFQELHPQVQSPPTQYHLVLLLPRWKPLFTHLTSFPCVLTTPVLIVWWEGWKYATSRLAPPTARRQN